MAGIPPTHHSSLMNFICGNAYEETLRQFSLYLYKLYKCPAIQYTRGDGCLYSLLLPGESSRAPPHLLHCTHGGTEASVDRVPRLNTAQLYSSQVRSEDFYFLCIYFKYYCYQVIGFCRLSKSIRELPIFL